MSIVKCFIVNVHAPSGSRNFCPRTTYPATRMTESTLTSVSWTTLSGTTPASSPGGKSKGGKQLAVVRRRKTRRKLSSNSARASATTKAFSTTLLTSSYCLEILARRGFIRWGRLMAIQQSFAKLCCNFNEVPTVLLADRVLFKLRQIREHTVSKKSNFLPCSTKNPSWIVLSCTLWKPCTTRWALSLTTSIPSLTGQASTGRPSSTSSRAPSCSRRRSSSSTCRTLSPTWAGTSVFSLGQGGGGIAVQKELFPYPIPSVAASSPCMTTPRR